MASRGKNKVILVGNVGKEIELRYMPNGGAVANFTIATSESWKDSSGQQQERTEWHRCVAYRKAAEIINQYVKKGDKIYVEGKLQTRQWTDQQGNERYITEINISEFEFMTVGQQKKSVTNASNSYQKQPSATKPPEMKEPTFEYDDDVPF